MELNHHRRPTLVGRDVRIYTPHHPMDYVARRESKEYAYPVTIGEDCWIGGGAIICPGVTIGNRCVIGAVSVVTKNVPDDSVVVGNPDKVFHIHFHRIGDNDEILFRDYLIAHPEAAKEYEKLKLSLLTKYKNDRDGYTEAKTAFVRTIVGLAKKHK